MRTGKRAIVRGAHLFRLQRQRGPETIDKLTPEDTASIIGQGLALSKLRLYILLITNYLSALALNSLF